VGVWGGNSKADDQLAAKRPLTGELEQRTFRLFSTGWTPFAETRLTLSLGIEQAEALHCLSAGRREEKKKRMDRIGFCFEREEEREEEREKKGSSSFPL
jgi:hypothetical protein